tara:strand:+ start:3501 stop:3722 length:222 start_codon:yes stop_codon:yes gene_type:complete
MERQYLDRESEEAVEVVESGEYIIHLDAMTTEKLQSKASIAIELARRDIRISQQSDMIQILRTRLQEAKARIR